MSFSRKIVGSVILIPILFAFSSALVAQESGEHASTQPAVPARKSNAARPALNEQQRMGQALFAENCTLCHMPSSEKKKLGIQAPPLEGVFGEDADSNELRQLIQQGIPGKMPAFRYDLDTKDVDDVVAFLKTGAYLKPSGGGN